MRKIAPKKKNALKPPAHSTSKPPAQGDQDQPIEIELLTQEDLDEINTIQVKTPLTDRETRLIELYLQHPTAPKWQIAQLAGYKCKSKQALINAFNLCLSKYESARDHREIFRTFGLGETYIMLKIKDCIEQEKGNVRLNAVALGAKCLQMTKEGLEIPQGAKITISRAPEKAQPYPCGPKADQGQGKAKGIAIVK